MTNKKSSLISAASKLAKDAANFVSGKAIKGAEGLVVLLPDAKEGAEQFFEDTKSTLNNKCKNAAEVAYAFREEIVVIGVLAALKNGTNLVFDSQIELAALEAIRRGYSAISPSASVEDISLYFQAVPEEEILGNVNHIVGITHEILVVDAINAAGDGDFASLVGATNNPIVDIQIVGSDGVMESVQLKATDSISYINEHLNKNPDVDVIATEEVANAMNNEQVTSSGFENEELRQVVEESLEELSEHTYNEYIAGGTLSVIICLAINLTPLLKQYFAATDDAEKEKIKAEIASTAKWSTVRTTAFITALQVSGLAPVLTTWLVAKTLFVVVKVYGPGLVSSASRNVSTKAREAVYKAAWNLSGKFKGFGFS
jgi:hypothetical protein